METLNLNIEQYIISDLENIFSLPYNYTNETLHDSIMKFKNLVGSASLGESKKKDIYQFIEKAKMKLSNIREPSNISEPSTIREPSNSIIESFVSSPEVTSYGVRNPVVKKQEKIMTKTINVDSRFRDNYSSNVSNNFTFDLEDDSENKVISMSVTSIDLPLSNYTFSQEKTNTKFMVIDLSGDSDLSNGTVYDCTVYTLPDGNYVVDTDDNVKAFNDIANNINNNVDTEIGTIEYNGPNNISLFTPVNVVTTNTLIDLSFNIYIPSSTASFTSNLTNTSAIHFLLDNSNNIIPSNDILDVQQTLGWQIGFRDVSGYFIIEPDEVVDGSSPCIINTTQYIYISIRENGLGLPSLNKFLPRFPKKTYNRTTSCSPAPSTYRETIISRLNIPSDENSVFKILNVGGGMNQLNRKRIYDGPKRIYNLNITLLDEYGNMLSLNNIDWSMTIELNYYPTLAN